jgi:peroxiredoxin
MLTSAWNPTREQTWAFTDSDLVECLLGMPLPPVVLASTAGGEVSLRTLAAEPVVIFVHPGTDTRREVREDPDGLLGTGCTMQSRMFDEYAPDFAARGVAVVGISARQRTEQLRFAAREHLSFPLLSDETFALADSIGLPTFADPAGGRVYGRLTLFAREGIVEKVFYPVPIPRRDAIDVLSWMAKQGPVL